MVRHREKNIFSEICVSVVQSNPDHHSHWLCECVALTSVLTLGNIWFLIALGMLMVWDQKKEEHLY